METRIPASQGVYVTDHACLRWRERFEPQITPNEAAQRILALIPWARLVREQRDGVGIYRVGSVCLAVSIRRRAALVVTVMGAPVPESMDEQSEQEEQEAENE